MRDDPSHDRALNRIGAISLLAGILHGIVTPSHFDEWWGYGLFFLVAASAQMAYGAIILFSRLVEGSPITMRWRPAAVRTWLVLGIIGNVAIIALYVVTRTVGIPFFGPEAGVVEEVRGLDVISKLLEVAAVYAIARLLVDARRAPPETIVASPP